MANFQAAEDTKANWLATNRVPLLGEFCIESDTLKRKIGDGSTAYASLAYTDATNPVPAYAAAASPASSFDTLHGMYNFKSSNTRILAQGLANAFSGGMTEHVVFGDSVSAGCTNGIGTVTYSRLQAWPLAMRDQLANQGVPSNGTGFIRLNDNSTSDARWTGSSGFTYGSTPSTMIATVVNSFVTLVPDRNGTAVDWWYYDGVACTFTVSVGGATAGAGFATVTTAASNVWKRVRLSGTNIVANVTTVTAKLTVAGSGVLFSGCSVWSPNGGLIVHNVAQSGSTIAGATANASWTNGTTNSPYSIFKDVANRTRQVTDGASTSGSPNLTSATAAFTADDVGKAIDLVPDASGIMFTPGSYIVSITSGTVVVLSSNALITASSKTVNIGRDPSCIHIALGGNDLQGNISIANIKAGITTLRNNYPKSDCILHLENELRPALYSSPTEQEMEVAMYQLADTLDVPLYDWRDRAGPYSTALANGIMQDYNAHMTVATYQDFGTSLAAVIGPGTSISQSAVPPANDQDLTNKLYVDTASLEPIKVLAPTGSWETTPRLWGPAIANVANPSASAVLGLYPVVLPKSFSVGHITFVSGSTAALSPTHWWFGLYDSARLQLAVTADQTSTAWAANTAKTLAIATTAAGASTVFKTTYAGLYYVGIEMSAGTVISLLGAAAPNATVAALGTALVYGASSTAQSTPPTFPTTATTPTGASVLAYAFVAP